MADNGAKFVNTLLDAKRVEELAEIQRYHGIKSRSETVRFLIRAESRRINAQAVDVAQRDNLS